VAVATIMVLAADAATAQNPHEHRGFWIGLGAGGGVNLSDGLDGASLGGGGGYLRLGGTTSQRVSLGFEGIGWGRDHSGSTLARGNGSFVALFYPSQKGGGFFKGGIGVSTIARSIVSGNTTNETSENGFGMTLGAGWDARLGNNIYFTPNLDLLLQWFEAKTDPVLGSIPGHNAIFLFTLGLTWH
jgi:hypothetical protein